MNNLNVETVLQTRILLEKELRTIARKRTDILEEFESQFTGIREQINVCDEWLDRLVTPSVDADGVEAIKEDLRQASKPILKEDVMSCLNPK